MNNFSFHNPTRIHFGKGQIAQLGSELSASSRILLLAGGGSIRKNGVYDQVRKALGGRTVVDFFGVEANPDYDTLMKAVAVCREQKLDFILAVGGGSVLDGAKFVAAAVHFKGEPWDILAKEAPLQTVLPVASVLTLPATGSESNIAAVISRRSIGEKLAFLNPLVFPKFSIIDPETTFSLPRHQVANGIADAFTHVLEQYMTYPVNAALQDEFAESIIRVLVSVSKQTLDNPGDYDARANLCWAATWALNSAIGMGVPQDWASHMIGHEITALHGLDHARTLGIVMPSLLQVQRAGKREKLLQLGERVFGLSNGPEEARVDATLALVRGFYEALGIHTRFSQVGIGTEVAELVSRRLEARGLVKLGERGDITPVVVARILREAA